MRRGCLMVGVVLLAMAAAGCWALDPDLALARAGFHLGRELAAALAGLLEQLAAALEALQG